MMSAGRFISSLFSLTKVNVEPIIYSGSVIQSRNYAVRKGTREKLVKKKLRNIAAKRAAEAKMPKKKKQGVAPDAMKYPETNLKISPDNVFVQHLYSWNTYSFEEAIQSYRNLFHPTIYDIPNARITAVFELKMLGENGKKPLGTFHNLVSVPHKFNLEDKRTVLVFVKTPEEHEEAKEAGATLIAGSDIIRLIRMGEFAFSDYNSIIAHPSMLSQLLNIKGILKNKFPNLRNGTLGVDLKSIIYKQLHGIKYSCNPDLHYPEYGLSEITFGTISMDISQLRENLQVIVDSIESLKPKKHGTFIIRLRLRCLPSNELLKVNLQEFIEGEKVQQDDDDDDDDDDEDNDTVARAEI